MWWVIDDDVRFDIDVEDGGANAETWQPVANNNKTRRRIMLIGEDALQGRREDEVIERPWFDENVGDSLFVHQGSNVDVPSTLKR